jgi:hypothetical protein
MSITGFKEWLSKDSPEGGGEIWDNRSNSDFGFGLTGAKSKYVAQDKSGQVELDPERLFFGTSKKNKNNKSKSSGKK